MRFSLAWVSKLLTGVSVAAVLGAVRRRARLRANAAAGETRTRVQQLEQGLEARQRTEEAERPAEEHFRTPADRTPNYAIFMVDSRGRNASWNTGVQRILGYEKVEFLNASVADLFTPEDRTAGVPDRDLAEAVEHGRASAERWLVRQDGTRLWASISTTSALDREGRLVGFAQRLRDLSDIRRVEEELRQNQEALEFALEAAGLGTWDHDLVTGDMRWDARAKALFGFPPEMAVNYHAWADAVHPEDLRPAETLRERALRDQRPFSIEYRVVWPDGNLHSIVMIGRGTFEPTTGKPLRMAGVMLDTTERKRTEERLQEVLRLEAIGRLAGGIAHDLNNMLAAILGFCDFLARSLQPNDPRRTDVEQITLAASRSANLTRQLLAFARRELIQPRRLDVNTIVRRAEGMLRPVLGESIELSLQLSPEVGVVHADPAQVEQILMNLVLNARDAMPQGGRVTVETASRMLDAASAMRHFESDLPPAGRYVMLAVSDKRPRDGCRHAPAYLGALLHDQTSHPGNWARPRGRVWCRKTERRVRVGGFRAGAGYSGKCVLARDHPGTGPVGRGGRFATR